MRVICVQVKLKFLKVFKSNQWDFSVVLNLILYMVDILLAILFRFSQENTTFQLVGLHNGVTYVFKVHVMMRTDHVMRTLDQVLFRLQNSPYFSARVGLNVARKGSGTSVKITSGIGERRASREKERLFCSLSIIDFFDLFHNQLNILLLFFFRRKQYHIQFVSLTSFFVSVFTDHIFVLRIPLRLLYCLPFATLIASHLLN